MIPTQEEGSITRYIRDLRLGKDDQAAQRIWDRYFLPLTRHAEAKLPPGLTPMDGPEDVALDALGNLFRRLRDGSLGGVHNRNELWCWLAVVATRRAILAIRHEKRDIRGGKMARTGDVDLLASPTPPPEFATLIEEEYERLIEALEDETLRNIVYWKMDDLTHEQIAQKLGCTVRTVARKVERIRLIWEVEAE